MLNIQFSVQGDANDKLVEIQAKGVVAALYAIYGDRVLPMPGSVTVTNIVNQSDKPTRPIAPQPPATNAHVADGAERFPEPDAAEAFQGNTAEYLAVHADEEPNAASAFGGTPAPSSPDVARDTAGIPWDERIHSSTKGTNKDGTWSRRRNTPDATFDAVMAELKGANTQRTMEAATALVPPPPTAPSVPAPPPVPSAPSATPAPPASSIAPAGGDALIDPESPTAFPDIMKVVTKAQAAGRIDTGGVSNLLMSLGVEPPSVATLLKQKHHIPAFQALLADHVAMQG